MVQAKIACATSAIASGVINFIQHGNGQKTPAVQVDELPTDNSTSIPKGPMTLQAFYDSLPKPFPENPDEKPAMEINAPGRLNTLVQQAKGTKLIIQYHWITHPKSGCEY